MSVEAAVVGRLMVAMDWLLVVAWIWFVKENKEEIPSTVVIIATLLVHRSSSVEPIEDLRQKQSVKISLHVQDH